MPSLIGFCKATGGAAMLMMLLSACVNPPKPQVASYEQAWSGRLSVTLRSDPVQNTQAGFSLTGNAQSGQLDLYTPLGGKAAQLVWTPNSAQLQAGAAGQGVQQFANISEAMQSLAGANIPIALLFDWLGGLPQAQGKADEDQTAEGWQVDLSQRAQGRIKAQRLLPAPALEIRVILDL